MTLYKRKIYLDHFFKKWDDISCKYTFRKWSPLFGFQSLMMDIRRHITNDLTN